MLQVRILPEIKTFIDTSEIRTHASHFMKEVLETSALDRSAMVSSLQIRLSNRQHVCP